MHEQPTPLGLCQCGCGKPTALAAKTRHGRGQIAGQPVAYVHGHNMRGKRNAGVSRRLAKEVGPRHPMYGRLGALHPRYKADRYREEDRGYETSCWMWQLSTNPKTGYGQTRHEGTQTTAHRALWIQRHGAIPVGYDVHHKCPNRVCCNPDHMELLTHAEHARLHNIRRWQRNES